MAKVRAQFDAAGPLIGRPWPLHYRDPDDVLVETLRSFGVRRFTALPYAHKPDMAEFLNDWAADFAERVPEAAVCGTFFPEPGVVAYVSSRLPSVEVWKVHVQVGAFTVTDPLLDEAWGLIAEAGTPVVLHAGSGPVPTEHTGPGPVEELLARHPRLRLVIAHAGAPEYADFLRLAETHERVGLDTTMAFTSSSRRWAAPIHRRCCRACATSGWRAGSTSAATSPTSPTRTPTSSTRSRVSISATSGCARCAGATGPS